MNKTIIFLCAAFFAFSANIFAQPRPVEKQTSVSVVKAAPAPVSFAAKYEGGMYGFSEKQKGSLKFDDANERLVFYSAKDQKEKFSIPYAAMLVIFPQSQSVTSTTGNIVRNLPLPGNVLGGLIKEKRRFLIVNYADADVDVKGLVNFKLENKALLDSVIQTLGEKAKLKRRGDAFYRPREVRTEL